MQDPLNQWLFPLSALHATPCNWPIEKELYDRARGIEFLFRLGSSLVLPTSAIMTAATWFHRFYMRFSMEDYHRQDVAASCIFLATKTEECGRKLRDVARICQVKILSREVPADSKEVEQCQTSILLTEEVLLEALCFDYVVESPHSKLVDLFDAHDEDAKVQECAWSFAHDSYRTILCLIYPPQIIATACYVLAQRVVDGPNSFSLDARISSSAPTASLLTPPSHKPPSPDATRFAIEHFSFNDAELASVAGTLLKQLFFHAKVKFSPTKEALSILLEFYNAQDVENAHPHLQSIVAVRRIVLNMPRLNNKFMIRFSLRQLPPRRRLYLPVSQLTMGGPAAVEDGVAGRTPSSSHGGRTPANKETSKADDISG
ncbi:Cyclin pch1 [Mycena sanguinolenta]|uniref:Cyclin pch1 n=1 Tax=Mycena sanguinolenta TaxID=230812 RepID=A0A8H6YQQ5_9AGAR|nr:Cyclin pch1 [Mycena sanguinolenta]